ncbi:MAG TPA: YkgJ family cysteine cluster protein [Bdellovibrionales bacterium]|nr:YkgJ family cysteine cluster protein [Bdellovibrionales bacterium]
MAFANPCVSCGACCANFRVQFYWREANPGECDHVVPSGLFEELTPQHRCMKGTNDKHHPKCQGLKGRIGRDASCSIYASRPTPCREFRASYSDGLKHDRCDQARARHGLKPLRPEDWRD